jgi:hypothetical protein
MLVGYKILAWDRDCIFCAAILDLRLLQNITTSILSLFQKLIHNSSYNENKQCFFKYSMLCKL